MGSFYVNFSIKSADAQQVASTLEHSGRRAIVTPATGGYVVAYDEQADEQDDTAILAVGSLLSRELSAPVFAVLNHDDDILCYWFFDGGELVDSYNSSPDYFSYRKPGPSEGGEPGKLCAVLGAAADPVAVEAILRKEYLFALERHQEIAELLGLPPWSVGFGYTYVARGELQDEVEDGPAAGDLIFVGGARLDPYG